ncbi:MAG TPA: ABC transporter ATP-binding protein [Bacteroidales bacterium]|nr:ABC transporter ATP-binding protein [Bacteroidales bacterium]
MPDDIAIRIDSVSKTYKGSIYAAVDDISLDIPRHSIFGLLGPNGAGKTTTISILCGLMKYDKGNIFVNGMDLEGNYKNIRRRIGLVPQDIALYETLTARENLRFIAEMYGLKGMEMRSRVDECLDLVGLVKNRHKQIRKYSGGMKRRINLAAAILHKPEILILDEPTTGVDVQSRNTILEFLKEINNNGTTIIYTSHYLEEAQNLCNEIAIIDHGKVIIRGKTREIIDSEAAYSDLESVFLHLTGRRLRD